MKYPPCSLDLFPNDLRLFPKIKCALKGWIFQYIGVVQEKFVDGTKKLFHNSSKNVSNSGSIIGLSAQLLKGSTSKVTPLNKLWVYRYEARNEIIPRTS
jgi:hypothetical protein